MRPPGLGDGCSVAWPKNKRSSPRRLRASTAVRPTSGGTVTRSGLGSGGLCGGGRSGGGLCGGGFGVEDCGGENGGSWTTIGGPDETTRLIRVSGEITAFGCGDCATTVPLGRPDGVLDTIGGSRRANCRNIS